MSTTIPINALEARDLNVFYGDHHVLKNILFAVPNHSVTAIIGPSGCGKSTLLRVFNRINDLIPNFRLEGGALVQDKDIYHSGTGLEQLRKEVGMVFQKPNPFPKTIFENVAYGLRIHGMKDKKVLEQRVEEALKQSWLWDEVKDNLQKSALALSGGQQQRLCIARALAVGPSILLMDEPASALDPLSTAKIEELIVELKKIVTIMIVTHNMQQAARVSDKTIFLYMGDMIEYSDTKELFTNPKNPRTQNYITGRFG